MTHDTPSSPLQAIKTGTQAVYERQANHWHALRDARVFAPVWFDRLLAPMPEGARLLDLGCGTGDPVTAYVLSRGFQVVGIDYAPTMIALAKAQHPTACWHVGDIRALPDLGDFDGIYSWDGFFHLSVAEQRTALPNLADLVRPGGSLLLTVGDGEGEVTGTVGGETVYHASLEPEEYEATLSTCGFATVEHIANAPDSHARNILLATGKEG